MHTKDNLLRNLVLSLQEGNELFGATYFSMPLSTVRILKDIADIYDLPDKSSDKLPKLELPQRERNNCSLMLHIWFA